MGPVTQMERRAKIYYLDYRDRYPKAEDREVREHAINSMYRIHGLSNNKAIEVVDTVIARLQR